MLEKYIIAIYIRLSLEDYKYDSLSIENQRLILREKAMSLPQWENAEILEFVDNGYTGTNFERPAMQELLSLVQAGKISCILVKDLSRFGRNSIETGYFIERVFPLYHTRFISVSDDYDSDNYKGDTGGIDVAFKYLINECYSKDMSIKTRSAKYAKMRRGEYQSVICPYGYQKSADGRMEPDEEAAAVVRLMFQWAAEGASGAEIARRLYARQIPTPAEYKAMRGQSYYDISRCQGVWSSPSVLRMLRDERYIGTYVIRKYEVREIGSSRVRMRDESQWYKIPNHHPAIISEETFALAEGNIRRFKLPEKKAQDYLLRGKIACGCCNHALNKKWVNNTWYCRRGDVSETSPCRKVMVPNIDLEQAVFETLRAQLLPMIGTDSEKGVLDFQTAQEAAHQESIREIQDQKRQLYEQFSQGEISLDTYRQRKVGLDEALVKAKNVHAAITAQTKQAKSENEKQRQHTQITQEIENASGLTKPLVDTLIKKVKVFPENHIEIEYAVQDFFAVP